MSEFEATDFITFNNLFRAAEHCPTTQEEQEAFLTGVSQLDQELGLFIDATKIFIERLGELEELEEAKGQCTEQLENIIISMAPIMELEDSLSFFNSPHTKDLHQTLLEVPHQIQRLKELRKTTISHPSVCPQTEELVRVLHLFLQKRLSYTYALTQCEAYQTYLNYLGDILNNLKEQGQETSYLKIHPLWEKQNQQLQEVMQDTYAFDPEAIPEHFPPLIECGEAIYHLLTQEPEAERKEVHCIHCHRPTSTQMSRCEHCNKPMPTLTINQEQGARIDMVAQSGGSSLQQQVEAKVTETVPFLDFIEELFTSFQELYQNPQWREDVLKGLTLQEERLHQLHDFFEEEAKELPSSETVLETCEHFLDDLEIFKNLFEANKMIELQSIAPRFVDHIKELIELNPPPPSGQESPEE